MDAVDDVDDANTPEEHGQSWAYSPFEQECLQEVEDGRLALEDQFVSERDASGHKMWLSFQNAAACIAQLYKGKCASVIRARLSDCTKGI